MPYAALSWTWGSPGPTFPILVNGNIFNVSENLFPALLYLRKRSIRFLWVDYICINQEDLKERASQVQLMQDVYRTADHVMIWLGEEDKYSVRAFDELHGIVGHRAITGIVPDDLVNPVSMVLHPNAWEAISCILFRPWFSRLWILQEVIAAKRAWILCGSDSIQFELFLAIVRKILRERSLEFIMSHHPRGAELGSSAREAMKKQLEFIVHAHRGRGDLDELQRYNPRLLNLLCATRWAQSSEPHDKVYAILGLNKLMESEVLAFSNSETVDLEVNYEISPERVSINVTKAIISSMKSLEVLRFAGKGQNMNDQLPSWVANWATEDLQRVPKGQAPEPLVLPERTYRDRDHDFPDELCYSPVIRRTSGRHHGDLNAPTQLESFKLTENDTLIVNGALLDVVSSISKHDLEESISKRPDKNFFLTNTSTIQSPYDLVELVTYVQSWVEYWAKLATHASRYLSKFKARRPLWALLETSIASDADRPTSFEEFLKTTQEVKSLCRAVGDRLSQLRFKDKDKLQPEEWAPQLANKAQVIFQVINAIVEGGTIASTKKKYIGIVPRGARSGDLICGILNHEEPVVLRRKNVNEFTFLGHIKLGRHDLGHTLKSLRPRRAKAVTQFTLI